MDDRSPLSPRPGQPDGPTSPPTAVEADAALDPRQLLRHRREMQVLLRRNYLAHSIEGGLYMGGLAFVASGTVLPVMVRALHGPDWLIALVPVLSMIGFQLPGLLVAHHIEKLHWVKPLVLITGVFQRLPYLLAGLALLFLAQRAPMLALAAVALCPLISGLVSGVSQPAWMELIAKTLPENRRSSVWAIRNLMAAMIGLLAGAIITWLLKVHPGPAGYGILHLITFGFLVASYCIFSMVRETRLPARPSRETSTLWTNLAAVPGILAADVQFRRFLLARGAMMGLGIMTPWLAIYALQVLHKGDEYSGALMIPLMIGGVLGNMMAGYIGDRIGGQLLLIVSGLMSLGLCVWAMFAAGEWAFLVIFFVQGAAGSFSGVGTATMTLEIIPLTKRATYLSLTSATSLPFILLAAGISAVAWRWTGGCFPAVAIPAAAAMVASTYFQWRIDDPHKRNQEN